MKNKYFNSTLIILIVQVLFFSYCKKGVSNNDIILNDKSIIDVQSYIQGKWKVHYYYGGMVGYLKQDRESLNEYYEFKNNDRVVYTYQNSIITDTTYHFITYQAVPTDYIHKVIEFYMPWGAVYHLEADKIKNDTLVLAQPLIGSPDYFSFFLTKTH